MPSAADRTPGPGRAQPSHGREGAEPPEAKGVEGWRPDGFGPEAEAGCGNWLLLCRMSDLPDGEARGFDPAGTGRDQFFIVRQGQALQAYRNSCPHWPGAPLPWRRHAYLDSARRAVVCHGHGARFTIDEGRCIEGPCLGQFLTRVDCRIENGQVWARWPMTP